MFATIPKLANVTPLELISKLADLFCELNLLHPFREGNGRTLRFFFEELIFVLGYDIEWSKISQQEWVDANVAGVALHLNPLIEIFNAAISANHR